MKDPSVSENAGIRDTAIPLHISINVAFLCTDKFSAYEILLKQKHVASKFCTQRIEREFEPEKQLKAS
ncbi:TPA: IS1 family transposase [Proteus mirabilis]|nr:IS1 family transposase [Proteus mirabilis]HEK1719041.1 IS1 family transposase [Proteus mirabilis]HEK2722619.1 IS1 family transposase [Proteus mirabilis]